jgi:hypothetical protein
MQTEQTFPVIGFNNQSSPKRLRVYLVVALAFFGFILSVTQVFGESLDYSQYFAFFDLARSEGLDIISVSRFEPGFSIFSAFLTALFISNLVVYAWIVAAAMLLKGWAINAYSSSQKIFLVLAIFYLVRYFPLHELTQLRAACAIALLLVGVIFLWGGNLRYGLLIFASSVFLQMSALAVIPALFLKVSKRWEVILIAISAYILTSILMGEISGYLANYIEILSAYQKNGYYETKPNPFAIHLLIDWWIIIFSLISWSRLTLLMRRVIMLELIGMAIFYAGIDFGVIAHRIRDFYSIFWVFFIADGLRLGATKVLSYSFVLVCVLFYSYLFILSGNFFH